LTLAIAPLGEGDIDAICVLAREIWRRHYPPIIGTAQTEYMLAQRYTPDVIREEIARDDFWWDTLAEDGAYVAFASSFRLTPGRAIKLDKLYVHPERQRRGYGAALIEHTCERARRLGCDRVVLAVNKRNDGAIAAYRKLGFDVAEAVVKDIGGGFVMDDYIMEKILPSAAAGGEGRE
jgi:GNAT superfamily N-acetyltransferase